METVATAAVQIVPYRSEFRAELSAIVKQFFRNSLNEYGQEMTDESVARLEESVGPTTFVLMIDGHVKGVIAGIVNRQLLSDKLVYQEIVWYVDESYRGQGVRMFRHLEAWARANGIAQIVMARMHNSMGDKIVRFYERMGYEPFETHYIRDL